MKSYQITQVQMDGMLKAASQQGNQAGWKRGFLAAAICFAAGAAFALAMAALS